MFPFDGEYPKAKFWSFSEENRKKSAVKHSIEKPILFKDTYREKAPSNKTAALRESMNMDIWVVDTSNKL